MYNELKVERDNHLRNIYYNMLRNNAINRRLLHHDDIVRMIIESPAPKFYLSVHQAEILLSAHMRGKRILKGVLKNLMVDDLVENYNKLMCDPRNVGKRKYEILNELVNMPAKRFYIGIWQANRIIFRRVH